MPRTESRICSLLSISSTLELWPLLHNGSHGITVGLGMPTPIHFAFFWGSLMPLTFLSKNLDVGDLFTLVWCLFIFFEQVLNGWFKPFKNGLKWVLWCEKYTASWSNEWAGSVLYCLGSPPYGSGEEGIVNLSFVNQRGLKGSFLRGLSAGGYYQKSNLSYLPRMNCASCSSLFIWN